MEKTNEANPDLRKFFYWDDVPVYPYIVSVAGHRYFDMPDEIVKETFRSILSEFVERWNKETKGLAPLVLLTGMADGADQIAAEVALEFDQRNVRVVAVLPFEEEAYLERGDKKDRVNEIIKRVSAKVEMPRCKENQNNQKLDDTFWDLQYKQVAEYLAKYSHTLFAFWDGIDLTEKSGGTSAVVRYKLRGDLAIKDFSKGDNECSINVLTKSSVGPVVHHFITRIYDGEDAKYNDVPLPCWYKKEENAIPVLFWTGSKRPDQNRKKWNQELRIQQQLIDQGKILSSHDLFYVVRTMEVLGQANCDSVEHSVEWKENKEEEESYKNYFPNSFKEPGERELIKRFSYMDFLSIQFQDNTNNTIVCYACISFIIVVLGSIIDSLWMVRQNGWANIQTSIFNPICYGIDRYYYLSVLFPLSLVFSILVGYTVRVCLISSRKKFHYRYHRYRTLAETFRVNVYWRHVGRINCNNGYYPPSYQIEKLDWLRCAVNGSAMLLPSEINIDSNAVTHVCDSWIAGQMEYFSDTIDKRRKPYKYDKAHKCETNSFLCLLSWFGLLKKGKVYWSCLAIACVLLLLMPYYNPIDDLLHNFGQQNYHPIKELLHIFSNAEKDGGVIIASDCRIFSIIVIRLIFLGLFPALVATSELYVRLKRFKAEEERYSRMVPIYQRAQDLLSNNSQDDEDNRKNNVLNHLGEEALSENAEWLLAVGERDLTLPR